MPQIGWFEILLIIVVSILVVGPKDFPIMLKKDWFLDRFHKKIFYRTTK